MFPWNSGAIHGCCKIPCGCVLILGRTPRLHFWKENYDKVNGNCSSLVSHFVPQCFSLLPFHNQDESKHLARLFISDGIYGAYCDNCLDTLGCKWTSPPVPWLSDKDGWYSWMFIQVHPNKDGITLTPSPILRPTALSTRLCSGSKRGTRWGWLHMGSETILVNG